MNPEEWGAVPATDRGVLSPSGTVGVRPYSQPQQAQAPLDPTAWGAKEIPQQVTPQQQSVAADPMTPARNKADQFADDLASQLPIIGTLFKILPRQAVEHGLTVGFSDEAKAGLRTLLGDNYEQALNYERQKLEQLRKDRPIATAAGEITGALLTAPLAPAAPVFQGANIASRALNAAVTGGAIGGLFGFGTGEESVQNRLNSAVNGAAVGALTGGVGAPLVEGAVAGARALARPFRGILNPEQEAQRRVLGAIAADNPNTPNAGQVAADTLNAANANGVPMVVADMGGDATRALTRSSANSNPTARTTLNNVVNDRFETQGDRISNTIRGIVGGNPDAPATRARLNEAARAQNEPAYKAAYAQGQQVWDETLASLTQAPAVQTAMRTATVTGANRAAGAGEQVVRNPFVTGPDGRLILRTNPDGSTATPSLQFWDHVKRNLDAMNTGESRHLAQVLRDHLDTLVPAYRTARAGAAAPFGAQDALEAGQRFASSSMPIKEARFAHQRLSNAERELFAQGFASDLLDKIAKVGDRRNLINSLFQSADARARLHLALGPQGTARLEAAARLENMMDLLRTALQGNSTTVRQLVELGLAGGSGLYGFGTGDWTTSGTVIAGLLARRGVARIDQRVAQRVAEMLASSDPQILRNAYDMVARNRGIMEAVRRAENDLSKLTVPNAPQITPTNMLPAAANQDQNNAPR